MLVGLNRIDKVGRLDERLVRARVKPGEALTEQIHLELALFEIQAVQVGDFELAARTRL